MNKEGTLHFRISRVVQETREAKTFELELLNQKRLDFSPGQFLTFLINTGQHEIRRSYSLLNLPGELPKITVKKVENGAISRFILQHWKTGEIVYALPPAGWFSITPQTAKKRDIFCFAAGSGIIPILPQIRHLLQKEKQSIIHLIYSNRDENDSLFLSEIESLSHTTPHLELINLFSDPRQRLSEKGRLSNISTENLVTRLLKFEKDDAIFLICGPFSYMRMIVFTLGLMNIKKENIRRENYLPEIMRAGKSIHKFFPEATITIKTSNISRHILVKSGESILDAGLRNDLDLPYSCRGGVCGSCAARCSGGKVHMSINEVLSDDDIRKGWILTCTGYPEDQELVIDFST